MSLSMADDIHTNGYHRPILSINENDDFVITGVSGRFPEANTIDEFAYNLFNGIDMVTSDDRRWPQGQYGLPTRNGKLKEVDRFDAAFFNVHPKQAHNMDPQLRLLLEVTYETICDAGINPMKLKGTKTGVFIGASGSDAQNAFSTDPQTLEGYSMTGCATSMFANRLSYFFDFKGPSYTIDTACSSSLLALDCALNALRNGACDAAIIGGVNLCFRPQTSLQFLKLQMLSHDGACRAFDSSGTGYVRSETVATVFIQKRQDAKRLYATLLHSKTNTDGWKKDGITFPNGDMQKKLLESIYDEIHLDPNHVGYVEAHGTGTRAGDPQEMNSITQVFCSKRNEPLLIGSTKSNMGHPEPASGIAALAKLLVAIQDGHIPANLHYNSPNTDIPGLMDGRLKVVTEKTKLPNKLMSINSFGFGGANVHAIFEANQNRQENENSSRKEPRLAFACARTTDGCENILTRLKEYQDNIELQALITENSFHPSHTHPYRGFTLLNSSESSTIIKKCNSERRPVWFVFSGMGTQWSGMGRDLMELKFFRQSIERSAAILKNYDIDLFKLILSSTPRDLDYPINSFVSIAAIQIALVDCLKSMGIQPDGIVGHSVGELGCAYADGCFTAEETILAAYFRGKCIQEANLPAGGMAAVGLTWNECKQMCPSDIAPACHNALDTVTVSGPKESIEKFVEELKEKKVFAKEVACNQVAFHSHYMLQIAPLLKKCLENIIVGPHKQRSSRWISSSVPEKQWDTPLALTSSPDYHVNNLCSPVLFQEALQHVPSNAIVIELAPHCLLLAILKRSLSTDCVHLNLMKRGTHDHVAYFYTNLGKLYNEGVNVNIMCNYAPIQYPVPVNVPFISPLIAAQWDHSQQWKIPTFEMFTQSLGSAQQTKHEIDLNDGSEYSSIIGHQIDGRCLFPATGYLTLVWKTFAKLHNYEDYRQMSVLFEQVQIHRATICSLANKVIFYVNILPTNGTFEIIENNTIIVTGRISQSEQLTMQKFHQQMKINDNDKNLQTNEIYRDFNLRGYEYSGLFRGINQMNIDGTCGELKWNNDWISYLDTMLQVHLIPSQGLQLPTRIDSLRIDPKLHLDLISSTTSTCSVHVDYWNSLCFSGGVELFGLHCTGTSKKNKQQNTILESYLFVPFDKETVDRELQTCLYLILENNLTTALSLCQIGNEKLSEEIFNFYSQQPSIKSLEYTLVTSLSEDEINKKIYLVENLSSTTTPVDLVIVNKIETNIYDWEKLFSLCKSNGFILVSSDIDVPTKQMESDNFIQIITRKNYKLWKKLSNENFIDTIVNIDEKNFKWIEQIKLLLSSNSPSQRVWLVSNQIDNGIIGFFNCLRREPGGQSLRCVHIQDSENILNENVLQNLKQRDLTVNVYQNGVWGSYVHRNLQTSNDSSWIQTDNAHVNVLNRGDLSSLTWLQSPAIATSCINDPNFDTCTVHYASLNFRDIMLATGKLSPEAIPGYLKMQGCLLGLEFSGLDSSGQRVMGLLSAKGLATKVAIDKRYSWRVPANWTLEQAATIPVVYATAYYALVVRGQLKRGEKVLIHAGTGGVGTAAIAIAYSYDCEVFTTVSSMEKREYLKKLFPRLNDEHIANSRDTTFEQQIRFITKGKGVNVVLNSLAEDKLQASVRLLAQHGRFLEIGKFDLSQNNPLGMGVFLKNTTFHGILLDSLFENANDDWLRVHQLVEQGIENGVVQPLHSNVFNANEIEQAFRFMSQGKHMGKVVIKVYDEFRPLVRALRKTWFSPNKTYIITGGLGGFGLELTEWLVERGARNLILCSRSGVRTGYQLKKINYLETFFEAKISISKLNITNEKECEELISQCSIPIGGIFHLAAVLQDGLFENLTADLFKEVVDIKYNGTKYLDIYTRIYSQKSLDYFVVFSSISCGRGNAGQTNYGYANSTMERICEQRQKDGLPGLAIQWGAIGDVGMVIENLGSNDTVVGGTLPQRMTSCLETIDYFLQQSPNIPVVSSYVLAEKLQNTSGSSTAAASLIETIANILGISDASTMSPDSTLADLGLDSLGSVEIKQLLEQKYSMSLANSKEIQQLTIKRLKEIDSGSLSATATAAVTAPNKIEKKSSTSISTVDFHQLLPKDLMILLNEKINSNKYQHLFLIHPIEGHVEMLRELAQRLPITVFGLQSVNDVPSTSIEDIAAYYIKKIIETQPTGPYLIGGYSFGACIAVEIALQLPSIAQLLLLDGSHSYVATHTRQYRTKFNEIKHAEAAVLYAFLQQFIPTLDQKRTLADLANLPSYDARLLCAAEILDKTVNVGTDNIILMAKKFHNKLLLAEKYVPSSKIQCETILFRVETSSEYSETIGNDYGLSTICQSPLQVLVIPGDHRTFLQGDNVKILADQIITVTCNSS
ncbi:unnamed protein product [Rotaria socialis]|uniref:Fatty acid synthase n=1 Tax=Rotaria socialis TaxID=392032 RepID=A0A818FBQ6_9BILA|nr:unnamed protein product [Rotaria socialis]CAF4500758.1 unnamed protein product [Rotaria socialis]